MALAGFPYVDYHPGFPYSVFLGPGGAQYNTPQMYWMDIGTSVNTVYAHTYAYNRVYQRADRSARAGLREPADRARSSASASFRGPTAPPASAGGTGSRRAPPGGRRSRSAPATSPASPPPPSTPILRLGLARRPRRVGAGAPGHRRLHDPDRRRLRPEHAVGGRELPGRRGADRRRNRRPGDVGRAAALRARAGDVDAHRRGRRLGRGGAQLARRAPPLLMQVPKSATRTPRATRSPAPAALADTQPREAANPRQARARARRRRAPRASCVRSSAGCARGATRPCARSGTGARRSRCWCGRARSAAAPRSRALTDRRAGRSSVCGSAASRAPSSGLRYVRPSAARRTACTSSLSAASLSTYPIAPARSASRANAGSFCMVSTTICVSGALWRRRGIAGRLDSPGHVQVEDQHARVVRGDAALGRGDVAGLGDDLESLLGLEQQAQPGADHLVIVGQDDRDRTAPRCLVHRGHNTSHVSAACKRL